MTRYFLSLCLIVVLVCAGRVTVTHAQRADLLTCDRHACTPDSVAPLFGEDVVWAPGMRQTRTFQIRNVDRSQPLRLALRFQSPTSYRGSCRLDRYLTMSVYQDGRLVGRGSIAQQAAGGVLPMGSVAVGQTVAYRLSVQLQEETPNDCQGANTRMDIAMRIQSVPDENVFQSTGMAKGTVLGAYTSGTASTGEICRGCVWWPLYALQIVLYAVYGTLLRTRRALVGMMAMGPVAAGIPIAAQLLYLVINSGCLRSWHGVAYVPATNPFCALMLVWSLAMYLVFLVIWGLLVYRPKK